jgi:hypothetical protein
MQRIADPAMPGNPNAGWECAHACLAAVGGQAGPDLAVGGACVAAKVTYCLPPVDGGDPCAGCRP